MFLRFQKNSEGLRHLFAVVARAERAFDLPLPLAQPQPLAQLRDDMGFLLGKLRPSARPPLTREGAVAVRIECRELRGSIVAIGARATALSLGATNRTSISHSAGY